MKTDGVICKSATNFGTITKIITSVERESKS